MQDWDVIYKPNRVFKLCSYSTYHLKAPNLGQPTILMWDADLIKSKDEESESCSNSDNRGICRPKLYPRNWLTVPLGVSNWMDPSIHPSIRLRARIVCQAWPEHYYSWSYIQVHFGPRPQHRGSPPLASCCDCLSWHCGGSHVELLVSVEEWTGVMRSSRELQQCFKQ